MLDRFRRSFRARLIAGAVIWITMGLGVSYWVLSQRLQSHAVDEFADELDHHITELAHLLRTDPGQRLVLHVPLSDHRFLTPRSGYYWQVEMEDGQILRSQSLAGASIPGSLPFAIPGIQREAAATGPTGPLMMLERVARLDNGGPVARVTVAMDQRVMDEFLATFRATLGLALAMIAAGLIAAVFAQVAYGLRPLGRMRRAVRAVQRGEERRLPADLPREVAPLAANVNALLETTEAMVRNARIQAGNLAHALKTPLAILQDEGHRLEAAGHDGSQVLAQCARMQRQIDYQLAKARAAASRIAHLSATPLAPALSGIVETVARLHRDRNLDFTVQATAPGLLVPCEAEDLDEILGNVVENAAKWARRRVRVSVAPGPEKVLISVEDDGPGMAPEARERVFEAGERLDEQTPGTGLGLAIVRDVTALYGGRCWIGTSADLGGAAVYVELPVPGAP